MSFFGSAQLGLLAEGLFDLLGPALIFGIYIIAAIAKNWVKRDQEGSEDQNQSELKKAVRKRYEQIRQRQVGEESQQLNRTPKTIPAARTIRQEENRPRQISQWEQQQQAIQQRNAKLQEQRMAAMRLRPNAVTQKIRPPKSGQTAKQAISRVAKTQKHKIRKQTKTVSAVSQTSKDRKTGNLLGHMMSRPENLRSAIILKEILDKPLALRDI